MALERLDSLGAASDAETARTMDGFVGKTLRWAGAAFVFFAGGIHVLVVGEHFIVEPYLGVLFLLDFFGGCLAAFAIYWSPSRFGWLLGVLVAGAPLVGFFWSRAVGLPGGGPEEFVGQWFNIAALLAVMIEGGFLSLALLALTPPGRAFLRMQQERIDLEDSVGREQPLEQPVLGLTPLKSPDLLEEEMAGTRSRMAADLSDLKKHVEPQVVKEQVQRGVWERLRAFLYALRPSGSGSRPPVAPLILVAVLVVLLARRVGGRDD